MKALLAKLLVVPAAVVSTMALSSEAASANTWVDTYTIYDNFNSCDINGYLHVHYYKDSSAYYCEPLGTYWDLWLYVS